MPKGRKYLKVTLENYYVCLYELALIGKIKIFSITFLEYPTAKEKGAEGDY